MAELLHTATVSHHRDPRGGLRTAWAVCVDCDWTGPHRITATTAAGDARDHEDGTEAAA